MIHKAFYFVGVEFLLASTTLFVDASESVEYNKDVFPILQKHCIACHTAEEAQGGLVMETYSKLMQGGDSGPALTPGTPNSSRMFMMAAGKMEPIMPPEDAQKLNESELSILSNWIEQGANGPAGEIVMQRKLKTPEIKASENAARPITAIAIAPSGMVYATAQYSEVTLVASDTEKAIVKLESQPGKVNSVRFNRDGTKLLIASGVTGLFGRAALYDVKTGKQLAVFEGHKDVTQIAIFSPDERTVATASYDREILLWDVDTSTMLQKFSGHNGAIYSLCFSPDGQVIVSGCSDQTVKVWDAETGQRLDTMSQPTGEVLSVAVSNDGTQVIAGSADNRIRIWKLVSRESPRINPIVATRFLDESPLTHMAISKDGTQLVVVSEAGNVKVLRTQDWSTLATLEPLGETASDISISPSGDFVLVSLMNGSIARRSLPKDSTETGDTANHLASVATKYLDVGALTPIDEAVVRKEQGVASSADSANAPVLPRGTELTGVISATSEEDWFAWDANEGEMWVIETDTKGLSSKLDSILEIRDSKSQPLIQARLQATRDSYFTFRGKNSLQNDDFRLFAWEEMKLNEYLYAAGEVSRLWLYPRGSDSGFNIYPGRGNRWNYFGTSGTVHALGEPAYIVRPLEPNEPAAANGLPIFNIYYANDDEPSQSRGHDSYILFKTPRTGRYFIRLRDTRGEGGEDYKYKLKLRPANPSFLASVEPIKTPLRRGSGRELQVIVERIDGYEGEVWFDIEPLPNKIHSNFPVRVQPEQSYAIGNIWTDIDTANLEKEISPRLIAYAMIGGKRVERPAGTAGKISVTDRPEATIQIATESNNQTITSPVQLHRGETISLVVKADRKPGFTKEISLGKELAGRNMPHGVFVDNIGLNGLLVRENESERQFFVTADPIAELGVRDFFLTGAVDGNVTSPPIQIEILP